MKPSQLALRIAAIALSALVVTAVFSVDYLPTNDGPQHIFATYASLHLDDAELGYGRYLEPGTAITSLGFDTVFRPLVHFLPWRPAHQCAVALIALVWAWGIMALAASLKRPWLGLLGFATAFQWLLYMGFYSFLLSAGVGMFVLAFACRVPLFTTKRWLIIAGLLFCQSIFHVFPAALTGLVVVAIAVGRAEPGKRLFELGRGAAMGVPAAIPALLAFLEEGQVVPFMDHYSVVERIGLLASGFTTGPWWRGWPPAVLGFGAAIWVGGRLLRRHQVDPVDRSLFLCALPFVVLAVALPVHVPTWQYVCVRFSPFGVVLLALLVPIEKLEGDSKAWIARAALVVFACTAVAWSVSYHRLLRANLAVALSGLEAPIKRTGPRLDLVLEHHPGLPVKQIERVVPFASPTFHLAPLYLVAQGGVTPTRLFAERADSHIVHRRAQPDGPVPPTPALDKVLSLWTREAREDLEYRHRLLTDLLSLSPLYEDVIFFGHKEDVDVLVARNFILDHQDDGMAIARFRPCPLKLDIADVQPSAVIIDGAWQRGGEIRSIKNLAAQEPSDSRSHIIADSPCGEYWVRVLFDRDDDGRASVGDAVCVGAEPSGFTRLVLEGEHSVFDCRASD